MKHVVISFLAVLGFVIVAQSSAPLAYAGDVLTPACDLAPHAEACVDKDDTNAQRKIFGPDGVLTKVANFIIMIVGVASVIVIMIGGFKYMVASGDPTNIKSAKDTIMYAIVGILVAVFGEAIVLFVLNRL